MMLFLLMLFLYFLNSWLVFFMRMFFLDCLSVLYYYDLIRYGNRILKSVEYRSIIYLLLLLDIMVFGKVMLML